MRRRYKRVLLALLLLSIFAGSLYAVFSGLNPESVLVGFILWLRGMGASWWGIHLLFSLVLSVLTGLLMGWVGAGVLLTIIMIVAATLFASWLVLLVNMAVSSGQSLGEILATSSLAESVSGYSLWDAAWNAATTVIPITLAAGLIAYALARR